MELHARERTKSVWTYVLAHRRAFESAAYVRQGAPLWPVARAKRMRLWEAYYCRWDAEFHPHGAAAAAWIPDYGNLAVTARAARAQRQQQQNSSTRQSARGQQPSQRRQSTASGVRLSAEPRDAASVATKSPSSSPLDAAFPPAIDPLDRTSSRGLARSQELERKDSLV